MPITKIHFYANQKFLQQLSRLVNRMKPEVIDEIESDKANNRIDEILRERICFYLKQTYHEGIDEQAIFSEIVKKIDPIIRAIAGTKSQKELASLDLKAQIASTKALNNRLNQRFSKITFTETYINGVSKVYWVHENKYSDLPPKEKKDLAEKKSKYFISLLKEIIFRAKYY